MNRGALALLRQRAEQREQLKSWEQDLAALRGQLDHERAAAKSAISQVRKETKAAEREKAEARLERSLRQAERSHLKATRSLGGPYKPREVQAYDEITAAVRKHRAEIVAIFQAYCDEEGTVLACDLITGLESMGLTVEGTRPFEELLLRHTIKMGRAQQGQKSDQGRPNDRARIEIQPLIEALVRAPKLAPTQSVPAPAHPAPPAPAPAPAPRAAFLHGEATELADKALELFSRDFAFFRKLHAEAIQNYDVVLAHAAAVRTVGEQEEELQKARAEMVRDSSTARRRSVGTTGAARSQRQSQAYVYIGYLEDKLVQAERVAEEKARQMDERFGEPQIYTERVIELEDMLKRGKTEVEQLRTMAEDATSKLEEMRAGVKDVLEQLKEKEEVRPANSPISPLPLR
eukprot:SAG11_NODE_3750_length_2251_cov_1.509758_2_plen_403_part_01